MNNKIMTIFATAAIALTTGCATAGTWVNGCYIDGPLCMVCDGYKVVNHTYGTTICAHCDGTGIEPPPEETVIVENVIVGNPCPPPPRYHHHRPVAHRPPPRPVGGRRPAARPAPRPAARPAPRPVARQQARPAARPAPRAGGPARRR